MLRVAKALIIIGCFCIQTYADETTTNSISINTEDKQTTNVRPINYNVILTPYFTDRNSKKYLTFESVVEIELQVERSVNNITLLSNKLLFGRENCSLQTSDGVDIHDFSVDFEPNENLVSFTKSYDQFPQKKLLLKINYTGTISKEEKAGIFMDFYINEKKENVSFIVALLSSEYTPSVFPCFLESDHKATFDVTINHDKNYVALSNMPIKNVSYEGSTATSVFKKTPPMDIHQLGLCVFDFQNISNDAKNITVWTTPQFRRYANFALNLAEKVITELEEFTNIPYEIGKLDLISLPSSWEFTIESWGLIIDASNGLIIREETANGPILLVQAIVQQWFGDVVSSQYRWLSSMISKYLACYILDKVEPRVGAMNYLITMTSPISQNDGSDIVIYDWNWSNLMLKRNLESSNCEIDKKGTHIVRMMQHIFTEPIFKKGLRNFLKKTYHRYGNLNDFNQAVLEVINNENVNFQLISVMDSWLNFEGYPILHVKRNYSSHKIEFQQTRFSVEEVLDEKLYNRHKWYIPINYASTEKLDFANTSTEYWLTNSSMTVYDDVKPKDWIIVNKQYTGFYIVNYDKTNWELIIDYLMSPDYKKIHLFNRYQLLNDAFLLAHEDKLDLTILLRLHSYLKNETNCLAWYPGFLVLDWLGIQLVYTESYPKFQEYALKTMQKLIDTIGFRENEQDDDFTKTCRARLFSVACKMGHQLCHEIALEKFEAWLRDPINNLIASNLEDAVLCYGLHNYENLDELFTSLDNKSSSYDPNTVESLNSIAGCSGNETFLRKRFNKFKNDSILDTFTLLSMMLDHNAIKLDTTLDLVIDDLYKIIRWERNNIMPLLFENAAGKVTSQSQQAKISRPIYRRAYKNAVNRGLDKSNKRIEWLKRNEQSVVNFITKLPQQQPLHDSNEKTVHQ